MVSWINKWTETSSPLKRLCYLTCRTSLLIWGFGPMRGRMLEFSPLWGQELDPSASHPKPQNLNGQNGLLWEKSSNLHLRVLKWPPSEWKHFSLWEFFSRGRYFMCCQSMIPIPSWGAGTICQGNVYATDTSARGAHSVANILCLSYRGVARSTDTRSEVTAELAVGKTDLRSKNGNEIFCPYLNAALIPWRVLVADSTKDSFSSFLSQRNSLVRQLDSAN